MFCKKCGKELEDGVVFCQFCGQKQTESTQESVFKKEEQISDKKLILTGVVMAMAILAVIAIFKLIGRDKENDITENMVVEEHTEVEGIDEKSQEEQSEETVGITDSEEEQMGDGEETKVANLEAAEKPQVSHMTFGEYESWFDEDGDLVKVVDGDLTIIYQYLTDSAGKKVCGNMTERFIDMTSAVSEIWNVGLIWPCNTKGHLIESIIWDDGLSEERQSYTYDGENVAEAHITSYQGDSIILNKDASFQYNEDQIIMSVHAVAYEDNPYDYQYEFICSFDGEKMVECVENSYSSEMGDSYTEREYDGSKNLIREKFNWTRREDEWTYEDMNETVYQYDNNGNMIKSDSRVESESWGYTEVTTSIYQYNEEGNMYKQESETYRFRDERQEYDNKQMYDYWYDANGNKVQEKSDYERLEYDEGGNVMKQSSYNHNKIWEYDAEGKLTYYSYLGSSTGNDVIEADSEYLYDEQDRLIGIMVDGETVMTISYTDVGILQQIDAVKEIENSNGIEWSLIYNLLPAEEKAEMEFFPAAQFFSIANNDVIIEYR